MHSNVSMLTLPEKALFVKLYFLMGNLAALQFYLHRKSIRIGKDRMTYSAVREVFKCSKPRAISKVGPFVGPTEHKF